MQQCARGVRGVRALKPHANSKIWAGRMNLVFPPVDKRQLWGGLRGFENNVLGYTSQRRGAIGPSSQTPFYMETLQADR